MWDSTQKRGEGIPQNGDKVWSQDYCELSDKKGNQFRLDWERDIINRIPHTSECLKRWFSKLADNSRQIKLSYW